MTETEKLLEQLCARTFLSLWSHPNPVRNDNQKELCDLLVVNKPFLLIFSVKAIDISEAVDFKVAADRWMRKAIHDSAKQLYGAERAISRGVGQSTADGRYPILVEAPQDYRIFRIAVAIGRGERFPLLYGDLGKGFVHTFDEISLPIILGELDTISDFTEYLSAKEAYFTKGKRLVADGEENMLAVYLNQGRKFPESHDTLIVDAEVWTHFNQKDEVIRKKRDDAESYMWDSMINEFYHDHREGFLFHDEDFNNMEYALRIMSKETRFARRILAHGLLEVIGFFGKPVAKSRIASSPSGITYVYLIGPHDESNREQRIRELELRCIVARSIKRDQSIVIGIATNVYKEGTGHSYDLFFLKVADWTAEKEATATKIREELGYFKTMSTKTAGYDEYPPEKST